MVVEVPQPSWFSGELASSFVASALWGILCTQAFIYFTNYRQDRLGLKFLVGLLWITETAHEVLVLSGISSDVLQPATFKTSILPSIVRWDNMAQILITGVVGSTAQLFFVYRLWMFTRKRLFPVVFIPAIFFVTLANIVNAVAVARIDPSTLDITPSFITAVILNASSATVDVAIAICMAHQLHDKKGDGFARTDQMIVRLVTLSINSGAWTAIIATAGLITAATGPNVYNYAAVYFMLSPMYCNTVLANLNARKHIRHIGDTAIDIASEGHVVSNQTIHIAIPLDNVRTNEDHNARIRKDRRLDSGQRHG